MMITGTADSALRHYTQASGSGDFVRDPDSFQDLGDVPNVTSADLERLLQAVTIEPVSATEWRWESGWRVGPRRIHDTMWFYVAEGEGCGWISDPSNTFRYQSGSMILLAPDTEHFIEPRRNSQSHVFAVHFHARCFSAVNLLGLLGLPSIWIGMQHSVAATSMRLTQEFALKKPGWRLAMQADIASVIFQLLRHAAPQLRPTIMLSSLSDLPRLVTVFQHIEDNLHKPSLSVLAMARHAYLSEVQFRKIFRRITGDSPLRFVRRRRVERACAMLHTSAESVSNIAEACGFSDAPFFHRVFKAYTGVTPREFRHSAHP
jgi:AraC-like DNA-binding protein/quercetin dioxygenase-like cupin family protein